MGGLAARGGTRRSAKRMYQRNARPMVCHFSKRSGAARQESVLSGVRAPNEGGLPLDLNSQSAVFGRNGQKRGGALRWVHASCGGVSPLTTASRFATLSRFALGHIKAKRDSLNLQRFAVRLILFHSLEAASRFATFSRFALRHIKPLRASPL